MSVSFFPAFTGIALLSFCLSGCVLNSAPEAFAATEEPGVDSVAVSLPQKSAERCATEKKFLEYGLVNIHDLDSTILVDLRYASEHNFLGINLLGDILNAYLQRDVAGKLAHAQRLLKSEYPHLSLIVYDAARPFSVQQAIWDSLRMPVREKVRYASNPAKGGSLHNYGAAVDAGLADSSGKELDMGCPFDYFGELAHPVAEGSLLQRGELTAGQINNRKILRSVMHRAGFFNIQTEWWHFNACRREQAMEKYRLIE